MPKSKPHKAGRRPRVHKPDRPPARNVGAHGWTGDLDGVPIRVLAFESWRRSAMTCLRAGDIEGWAAGALHPHDVQTFIDADVSMRQLLAFITQAKRLVPRWTEPTGSGQPDAAT